LFFKIALTIYWLPFGSLENILSRTLNTIFIRIVINAVWYHNNFWGFWRVIYTLIRVLIYLIIVTQTIGTWIMGTAWFHTFAPYHIITRSTFLTTIWNLYFAKWNKFFKTAFSFIGIRSIVIKAFITLIVCLGFTILDFRNTERNLI